MIDCHFSLHACRRTFASVADAAGLGFLTVKRMLNHHFQGGVTGGYIVRGFNPASDRENFQKVCNYILERRQAYLQKQDGNGNQEDFNDAINQVRQLVTALGLSERELVQALKSKVD